MSDTKHKTLQDKVQSVLERIRPIIQQDDGDVELVSVTPGGKVTVRFLGACVNCPSSSLTLKSVIERNLTESIPEVTSVSAIE